MLAHVYAHKVSASVEKRENGACAGLDLVGEGAVFCDFDAEEFDDDGSVDVEGGRKGKEIVCENEGIGEGCGKVDPVEEHQVVLSVLIIAGGRREAQAAEIVVV
jgi:hypothetical protein